MKIDRAMTPATHPHDPALHDAFYDALETRSVDERERALMAALPVQLAHARAHAPAFARSLAAVDPARITDRAALATLPVVRKHELLEARHGSMRRTCSAASPRWAGAPGARL